MDWLLTWQGMGIALLWSFVVYRIGFGLGRLAGQSGEIMPISTTRISPEGKARIEDALRRGEKIAAIRLLRDDTGCGLAEAKKTVEAMEVPGRS